MEGIRNHNDYFVLLAIDFLSRSPSPFIHISNKNQKAMGKVCFLLSYYVNSYHLSMPFHLREEEKENLLAIRRTTGRM